MAAKGDLLMDLYRKGDIGGIIGLGGSMGTTLVTYVMQALSLGFPKVMITTMASQEGLVWDKRYSHCSICM